MPVSCNEARLMGHQESWKWTMMARSGRTGMTPMERSILLRIEKSIPRDSCISAVRVTGIREDVNVDRTFRERHRSRDPAIEVSKRL